MHSSFLRYISSWDEWNQGGAGACRDGRLSAIIFILMQSHLLHEAFNEQEQKTVAGYGLHTCLSVCCLLGIAFPHSRDACSCFRDAYNWCVQQYSLRDGLSAFVPLLKAACDSARVMIWFIIHSHPSHTVPHWMFHNCYGRGQKKSSLSSQHHFPNTTSLPCRAAGSTA